MKNSILLLKLIACVFLLFNVKPLKAQTVVIPDAGFVQFLQANYPSCMSGNLMDTTCADIVNETILILPPSYNVANIDGIQYFDNLDVLTVSDCYFATLPHLPQDLIELNAYHVGLQSITNFPATLEKIDITWNFLASVPPLPAGLVSYQRGLLPALPVQASLPSGLESYSIRQCGLDTMPPLPAGLKTLRMGINPGINIPIFPTGLDTLDVELTGINNFSQVPNSVQVLYAAGNDFDSLSTFPTGLDELYLQNCDSLTTIQNLPSSLQILAAGGCDLSFIDNLPSTLVELYLNDNSLNELPSLPVNLNKLALNSNFFYCLPVLPSSLSYCNLDNNFFTCVPNIIPAMPATYQAYPLCATYNSNTLPYGCFPSEGVVGSTFLDQNSNCSFDGLDQVLENIQIKVLDNSGNLITTSSSLPNGMYNFHLNNGQYDIVVDTLAKPYTVDCINPGLDSTVNLSISNPLAEDVNFGLKCKPGFDVGTQSINTNGFVFPGMNHTLTVKAGDIGYYYNMPCVSGVSGSVTITISGPVIFQYVPSGSLSPAINSGTFSYSISDFGNIDPNTDFRLVFQTDTLANIGDQICVNVNVTPSLGDLNPLNNDYDYCYDVVNSYDPNNKLVFPSQVTPTYSDYISYTINFQNTGNAPAMNIRLEDTLSSFLDLSTFEVIDYSHPMHFNLTGDKLRVNYPNIMLVDSTTSEPDSKGYFTYRIKPNGTAVIGDQIENTAYIFFDFNAPIVTNTAITEVGLYQSGFEEFEQIDLTIYPNPSSNEFNIRINENILNVQVYNQQGQLVKFNYDADINQLDLVDNDQGIYFLHVVLEDQTITKKLIKK